MSNDVMEKSRLADHATSEGAKSAAAVFETSTKLASDAIGNVMELAKQGAWVFLLAVGALVYAVAFGMEVHVWDVGTGTTLSTGRFGIALAAGAFVLTLGAVLRLYALHQIAIIQQNTAQLQKDLAEETIVKLQEGAQDAIKQLSVG
jgi:hypothetical protein